MFKFRSRGSRTTDRRKSALTYINSNLCHSHISSQNHAESSLFPNLLSLIISIAKSMVSHWVLLYLRFLKNNLTFLPVNWINPWVVLFVFYLCISWLTSTVAFVVAPADPYQAKNTEAQVTCFSIFGRQGWLKTVSNLIIRKRRKGLGQLVQMKIFFCLENVTHQFRVLHVSLCSVSALLR